MKRLVLAVVASCASPPPAPAMYNAAVPITGPTALEGRVVDSATGAAVAGVGVEAASGSSSSDEAFTDEHGRFHLEVDAGSAYVQLEYGSGSTIALAANHVTQRDLRLDHAEVLQRAQRPPAACPSSPRGAVILGHSTPQAEIDAIAHRVLERYAADPKTVPDGELAPHISFVRVDLDHHRRVGAGALPAGFAGKTRDELAGESKRLGSDVYYVDLRSIDADPTCALVWIGVNFVDRPRPGSIKTCCCSAAQLYELRNGRWEYVGNTETVCS